MQLIHISEVDIKCHKCGIDITDIANLYYDGITLNENTFREEKCRCRNCDTPFLLHYNLFDKNGHINQRVFSEDVNDPSYDWMELLSGGQKRFIEKHLHDCQLCQDSLVKEQLSNAWFGDLICQLREKHKIKKHQKVDEI